MSKPYKNYTAELPGFLLMMLLYIWFATYLLETPNTVVSWVIYILWALLLTFFYSFPLFRGILVWIDYVSKKTYVYNAYYICKFIEEEVLSSAHDERTEKKRKGYLYSRVLFKCNGKYIIFYLCTKPRLQKNEIYKITYGQYSKVLISIKNTNGHELLKTPKEKKGK